MVDSSIIVRAFGNLFMMTEDNTQWNVLSTNFLVKNINSLFIIYNASCFTHNIYIYIYIYIYYIYIKNTSYYVGKDMIWLASFNTLITYTGIWCLTVLHISLGSKVPETNMA